MFSPRYKFLAFYSERLHATEPTAVREYNNALLPPVTPIGSIPRSRFVNIVWKRSGEQIPFSEVAEQYPDAVYQGDLTDEGKLYLQWNQGKTLATRVNENRQATGQVHTPDDWFMAQVANPDCPIPNRFAIHSNTALIDGYKFKPANENKPSYVVAQYEDKSLKQLLHESLASAHLSCAGDLCLSAIDMWREFAIAHCPREFTGSGALSAHNQLVMGQRDFMANMLSDIILDLNSSRNYGELTPSTVVETFFEALQGPAGMLVRLNKGAPIKLDNIENGALPPVVRNSPSWMTVQTLKADGPR